MIHWFLSFEAKPTEQMVSNMALYYLCTKCMALPKHMQFSDAVGCFTTQKWGSARIAFKDWPFRASMQKKAGEMPCCCVIDEVWYRF